jgi:hypothetical protein
MNLSNDGDFNLAECGRGGPPQEHNRRKSHLEPPPHTHIPYAAHLACPPRAMPSSGVSSEVDGWDSGGAGVASAFSTQSFGCKLSAGAE